MRNTSSSWMYEQFGLEGLQGKLDGFKRGEMMKPVVIWLDDLLSSPHEEVLRHWKTYLDSSCDLRQVTSVRQFSDLLLRLMHDQQPVHGLLIDLMLTHGEDETNMSPLGVPTQTIKPERAGLQLLKILRSETYDAVGAMPRATHVECFARVSCALFSTNSEVSTKDLFLREFSQREVDQAMKDICCIYQSDDPTRTLTQLAAWVSSLPANVTP